VCCIVWCVCWWCVVCGVVCCVVCDVVCRVWSYDDMLICGWSGMAVWYRLRLISLLRERSMFLYGSWLWPILCCRYRCRYCMFCQAIAVSGRSVSSLFSPSGCLIVWPSDCQPCHFMRRDIISVYIWACFAVLLLDICRYHYGSIVRTPNNAHLRRGGVFVTTDA
jgi:hypothetical protein